LRKKNGNRNDVQNVGHNASIITESVKFGSV